MPTSNDPLHFSFPNPLHFRSLARLGLRFHLMKTSLSLPSLLVPLSHLFLLSVCCRSDGEAQERTLAMIKPDGVRGNHTAQIKGAILEAGFEIVQESTFQLDFEKASVFYAEHSDKSFFQSLIAYITSGPVLAMVLEKPNAVSEWRELIGPTDVRKAKVSHPRRSKIVRFEKCGDIWGPMGLHRQ